MRRCGGDVRLDITSKNHFYFSIFSIIEIEKVARGCFDQPTFGLWAQRSSNWAISLYFKRHPFKIPLFLQHIKMIHLVFIYYLFTPRENMFAQLITIVEGLIGRRSRFTRCVIRREVRSFWMKQMINNKYVTIFINIHSKNVYSYKIFKYRPNIQSSHLFYHRDNRSGRRIPGDPG